MHNFATVFIWRLNVIQSSMYRCEAGKGWVVVVGIVSPKLSWNYISQNPCLCRAGPKGNFHEVWKAGMKQQTLLSEGSSPLYQWQTQRRAGRFHPVLASSTPLSVLLPNCCCSWPVLASDEPLVAGQQTQRGNSYAWHPHELGLPTSTLGGGCAWVSDGLFGDLSVIFQLPSGTFTSPNVRSNSIVNHLHINPGVGQLWLMGQIPPATCLCLIGTDGLIMCMLSMAA